MLKEERKKMRFSKLLESISNDLFLIKLELKLIRIDELLDKNGDVLNQCEDNLQTPFQRVFFCKRRLRSHIFWAGDDRENINKVIDQLYNNFGACEDVKREELLDFVDCVIVERTRLIEASKEMILKGEIAVDEYRKAAMAEFERDKIGLSRIEALYRLNRIQWLCEVVGQMERYFKQNNKLDEWKYKMPFDWGNEDERATLDF